MARDDYMVGNNEYVDAKYFDELLECLGEVLVNGVEARGKKPGDNWGVTVSSLNLRSLLDYCAILRPLLDAVELGEVEQYREGFRNGHRDGFVQGQAKTLEYVAERLEQGAFRDCSDTEVAEYLRSLKSKG